MDKLRMRFRKEGRAVYISHLDLMHTLQRVFTRTGYNLKHSEGFNPHPQMSILLPLSVGCSSCCEIMDFLLLGERNFNEEELKIMKDKLNSSTPEGIQIDEIYPVAEKPGDLKWLKVTGQFEYDIGTDGTKDGSSQIDDTDSALNQIKENIRAFFTQDTIVIKKKTKSGISDFDVKTGIRSVKFSVEDDHVNVDAIISAQAPSFNPELITEALRQHAPQLVPVFSRFSRMKIYDKGMNIFR